MSDLKAKLSRHLAACSVAAFATCAAVAPDAKAVVIYYEPNAGAGWVIPDSINGLYINVETQATGADQFPGWDINPFGSSSLSWLNAVGAGMLRYPGMTSGPTGNLALGTTVGSTGSYNGGGPVVVGGGPVVVGSAPGNWQLDATNYFGFKFLASDNQTHYGWGAMQVGSAITTRTITAIGWEDQAGVAILVGDTGAPASVPGPLPLFGVAAAFSWSRRLRRRTLQASKQPAPATTLTSCKPPA
jgi:hypothetical protein